MKLGIVGVGTIVKEFLTLAPFLPEYEIVAICGLPRHEKILNSLKNQYGIANVYTDIEDMLESDVEIIYIGVPNDLHYEYAQMALEAGRHVIVEKPFATNDKEVAGLIWLSRVKQRFVFEAISNQYLPNYQKIKELLPQLGKIKIVQCNFSQYSGKYDRFKNGENPPVFSPECCGGALMDLNLYNIYFVTGLFGEPEKVEYYPNIERGIDTSGILMMKYKNFQCVCVGAKDCKSPAVNNIQGELGYISMDSPTNMCEHFSITMNDGSSQEFNENNYEHRMINEFKAFADMINNNDYESCYERLEHSFMVSRILTKARRKAGINFPFEEIY